ncbi:MAG TPA: SDR family oxidoreductase [Pyrinomonadaceae bacterium]|nr:SDR family oxidoreductase [Pyrinomonadaceae bacterium]
MKIKDKIILITGGANGIGKGLCKRFAKEGAEKIIVTDIDFENANKVAKEINGVAFKLDVSNEAQVKEIVTQILDEFGRIDLVCSNAGIGGAEGCLEVSNEVWQKIYEVNVLSHVYLARAVFPSMIERGEGYFLVTASAAGLLTHPCAAPYVVTKHGAVALAESLSIEYHEKGIRVSCLCPQGVETQLIMGGENNPNSFLQAGAITVEECAEYVLNGLESEKFLILPHEEVAQFIINKAENRDRWLHSLRKIRTAVLAAKSK